MNFTSINKTIVSISLTLLIPLTQAGVLVPRNERIITVYKQLLAEEDRASKLELGLKIGATAAVSASLFYWYFLRDTTTPNQSPSAAQVIQLQNLLQQLVGAPAAAQPAGPAQPAAPAQPRTWAQSIRSVPSAIKAGAVGVARGTTRLVKSDVTNWAIHAGLGWGVKVAMGNASDIARKLSPAFDRIANMYSPRDLRWYIEEKTSLLVLKATIEDYAREYALVPYTEKAQLREALENTVSALIEDTEKALGFMMFYVKRNYQEAPIKTKALNAKIVLIRGRLGALAQLFNDKVVRTQEDAEHLALEIVELNNRLYNEVSSFQATSARRSLVDPVMHEYAF